MTLTQMQYFKAVCEYESYTKAAAALYVSQPAISKAMRELESECAVPLFNRHNNNVSITEEGYVLLHEVSVILRQCEQLETVTQELALKRNYIRIGLSTFNGNTVFPQLRRNFHLQYPGLQMISREDTTVNLFNMLDTGQVDIILTSPTQQSKHPSYKKLYKQYPLQICGLRFCVSRDHPLAGQDSVTMDQIAREPLVMLEEQYGPTQLVKKLFARHQMEPTVIHYTTQMYTVERFVEQNAAAGFMPRQIAESNPLVAGLTFPNNTPDSVVMLIWRRDRITYAAVRQFITVAQEMYPRRGEIVACAKKNDAQEEAGTTG